MAQWEFKEEDVEVFFEKYYVDRGMMKWQGYYLSDHTSMLNVEAENKRQRLNQKIRPQDSKQQIAATIEVAITKCREVVVQIDERDQNNQLAEEIQGKILGYSGDELYFGDDVFIKIELIRNIRLIN
ncbi:hypothetical protein [Pediococcus stilesii]|uniref:DNA-directed RNA polymerase beta subunit n=1 Tax=Pediococcus stilesii TaxID=331679 RepID=A0A0R2KWA7_9LACO|nr:hypothetical protein [Pediococcus stilesii]KRN93632.1 hypothetical protein IV81_GL000373 [Pediococcus stilesii]TLQ05816.1 hypothetical protein FEZ51_01140 [Pediococcus stilesii]